MTQALEKRRPLGVMRQNALVQHIRIGRNPCYVLEVRGDSMIEEGILDGDYYLLFFW